MEQIANLLESPAAQTNPPTARKPWHAPKYAALAEISETAKDINPIEITTPVGPS